jgi:outer membrane protein assembly factor BamB
MRTRSIACLLVFSLVPCQAFADPREDLWAAARKGDKQTVEKLLGQGIDVNAATSYGATALWFAAMNGQTEIVKLLVRHHADLDHRDGIWNESPVNVANDFNKLDVVDFLLRAGAKGADELALAAVRSANVKLLETVVNAAKIDPEVLSALLLLAPSNNKQVNDLLAKAGAKPFSKPFGDATPFQALVGDYEDVRGLRVSLVIKNGFLIEQFGGRDAYVLKPVGDLLFRPIGQPGESFVFERSAGKIDKFVYRRGSSETLYLRGKTEEARVAAGHDSQDQPQSPGGPSNWPMFRGPQASGVADGQHLPASWDIVKGRNVLWKVDLAGLAHSSPIAWNGKIFLTTAVSSDPKSELKIGLYGAGDPSKDVSVHRWVIYCLNAANGKALWERTAHEGAPRVKRHMKSSHANPTPVTDGKHLIVSFASEGLYCYDLDGKLLWQQDLGLLDDGAFNAPELQWGAASSPIIFRNLAIVQCDRQKDSYVAAFDLDDGRRVWSTPRDEIPSWGTPNVYDGPPHPELVLNATHHICAYDPLTGKELWRLSPNSQITTPTPISGDGLIFVTSGYHPTQPIYAIRAGGSGDISLKKGEEANTYLAWTKTRGGPYTPTPILYDHLLYACSNQGVVNCYDARTGKEIYRQRLGGSGGYSASPVAADGRIYFTSEAGEIRVVKAGPDFQLLAVNKMDEPCMATPAIANGMLLVRSQHHIYAIGWPRLTAQKR